MVKLAEAEAEALLGDTRRARAAAEAALAVDERPFVLMAAANVMAWTGDVTRGRLLLDRFERRPVGGLSLRPVSLAVARALAELKSGQPARARELIRPASPLSPIFSGIRYFSPRAWIPMVGLISARWIR